MRVNQCEHFNVRTEDGIVSITMDLPPLNVLDNPMMAEFNDLLEPVVLDKDVVAVVIGATGKVFSAGVDVADHSPEKVGDMIRLFHGIFRKLASTDALTVAAVQGAALGGACELACFCDVILASDRAKFGLPEVKVGVFPPVAAAILPGRLGIHKAVELVVLGETIGAVEAHRVGLVSQVFPAAEFDRSVQDYLKHLRSLSRPVVRLAKKATMLMERARILSHLEQAEHLYLNELMTLSDAHEGIAAFIEKRAPEWSHA